MCVDTPGVPPVIQFLCLFTILCGLDAEFSITLGKRSNFYENISEQCGLDWKENRGLYFSCKSSSTLQVQISSHSFIM